MAYFLIPLVILAGLLVLLGIAVFLGRYKKGKYLRPIVTSLSKVPFLRRWFQKVSAAALERQNPDLASAMRKLQRVGPNPDPQKAQQALGQLSPVERRAYFEALEEQGGVQPANRQQRRQQQRMQGQGQGQGNPRPGGTQPKRGKRR